MEQVRSFIAEAAAICVMLATRQRDVSEAMSSSLSTHAIIMDTLEELDHAVEVAMEAAGSLLTRAPRQSLAALQPPFIMLALQILETSSNGGSYPGQGSSPGPARLTWPLEKEANRAALALTSRYAQDAPCMRPSTSYPAQQAHWPGKSKRSVCQTALTICLAYL